MRIEGLRRILLVATTGAMLAACGGDGTNGSSCSVKDNGDGTATISCTDGTKVTVSNGTRGDSCSVKDNSDGTKTITCEDGTSVTVTDGVDGSCTIVDNNDGTKTITCSDGTRVTVSNGRPGQPGGGVEITSKHGTDYLQTIGEFLTSGKYFAKVTITSATADAGGKVTVSFDAKTADDKPVLNIATVSANIAKLVPPGTGEVAAKWVPYIWRVQTVSGSANGNWPNPDGTKGLQGTRESAGTGPTNGTLTHNGNGSYTYEFKTNLSTATADGTPIPYERNRLHRVSVMMGGRSGATADAVFDFVPDGSPVTQTRNIITTAACKACHGDEFHGHGGDRLGLENCATCHVPGATDPQGGENLDLKVMIHKIHAGGELASIPGPDGLVWDNPATPANEAADNGSYAIWGNGNSKHEWWKVGFPAIIANCTKCHIGNSSDVDNWKTKPSRDACGSCHDQIDWATGTNHGGGVQTSDTTCSTCHPASDPQGLLYPIPESHDFLKADPRNVPEFEGTITFDVPARGYYIAGEAPKATIVLKDKVTGQVIDHTTVVRDTDGAEGCLPAGCPAGDGKFTASSFFVHGPRGYRMPVLTTAARAQIVGGLGPYDLSVAGASLILKVDGGRDLVKSDAQGTVVPANITVTLASAAAGTFANLAAATPQEIANWLNANAAFKARALAFLDPAGKIAIRSRNLGPVHALQLLASAVTTTVFAGDVAVKLPTGSTTSNSLANDVAAPANNDPKVTRTAASITYQMDPVDDLAPGTYVANIEMTDRGRRSATDYRTPVVAKAPFQVGTATVEKPPAGNCDLCHQNAGGGEGFILDFARHYKIFDQTAIDQCGACHDRQPQSATGASWSGARPISKRVHAVHYGSSLNHPLGTVDYSGGDPVAGRNWDITFPQDVRNCQTCHEDGTTSGSWATEASRLPCSGCHDSDAAKVHFKLQTFDPTPADPWSGDEEESCKVCH